MKKEPKYHPMNVLLSYDRYHLYNFSALHHIKGHVKWPMNLTVVSTIISLPTNMRIPTTTEFLALFVATGKFSAPSMRKIPIHTLIATDWLVCLIHVAQRTLSSPLVKLNQHAIFGIPSDRVIYVTLSRQRIGSRRSYLHTSHLRILFTGVRCNAVTRSYAKMTRSMGSAPTLVLAR